MSSNNFVSININGHRRRQRNFNRRRQIQRRIPINNDYMLNQIAVLFPQVINDPFTIQFFNGLSSFH
jgi:hypothetical protein